MRPTPVTDDDVEAALGQMREQHAELRSVERAAAPGDVVIVDYTLEPRGAARRASESGYAFRSAKGRCCPEIDQAVVGMQSRRGARGRRSLLGRAPTRRVARQVGPGHGEGARRSRRRSSPLLDDDFAKQVGEFDTLDAVRAEVRRQLEAVVSGRTSWPWRARWSRRALARHEFSVPDAMVMRQLQHQVEHTRERLRRQGVDPDRVQWDYDKLMTDLRPGAERAVRRTLLLEAISDAETMAPTEADVEAEIEKLATASRRPAPAVRRMMEKSGDLDALRSGLREQQTLDFLIRHATVHPRTPVGTGGGDSPKETGPWLWSRWSSSRHRAASARSTSFPDS